MALIKIDPTEARVAWDRVRARPARIVASRRRLRVVALAGRRDELAAFPADQGPRITYVVETDHGQASVVFHPTTRRWYLEAIEEAA